MEPTGLQLREPATITLIVDSEDLVQGGEERGASVYFLVIVSNGGTQEVFDEVETLYAADGSVRVTAQLSHFNWIRRTKGALKAELAQIEPRRRMSGSRFKASFGVDYIVPSTKETGFAVSITAASIGTTGVINGWGEHLVGEGQMAGLSINPKLFPFEAPRPGIEDPNQFACGFGTVKELRRQQYQVPSNQYDAYCQLYKYYSGSSLRA